MSKCGHEPFMGYGFFPGGDPREFFPEAESCTAAELAAHKEACERWERGETKDEGHSGRLIELPGGGAAIACGHRFGIGTYSMECDCGDEP